jgi:transposase InsO family protein
MIYPLVREMAAQRHPIRVPVTVACRVLGFTEQAYYKWVKAPVSAREREEIELIGLLRGLHDDDPEGGYRVLADDLGDLGYQISERRVWRLCKVAGICSTIVDRKRRYKRAGPPVHDDLVQRDFTATERNKVWLTDITEHRTGEGKLYCCAIKDVFSNMIVGYAIDSRMKARLAVAALEMAVSHRGYPRGVVVHSDRGGQFRSRSFTKALTKYGLHGSMGRVGACGDNAAMESFFSLLQKNVFDRQRWDTRLELRLETVRWIEGRYHRKRRQRRLGKLTPVEFELITQPDVHLATK